LQDQLVLFRKLRLLRSGKPIGWLANLAREADENQSSSWTPNTWADLEKNRGKRITHAAQKGCMTAWRMFSPQLPHEKSNPSETSIGVIVGLTGLKLEFETDPLAELKLSQNEAKLAARYAMNELNGFPAWFERLASAHPVAVTEILNECAVACWHLAADKQDGNQVLSHLAWHSERSLFLVQKQLLSLLEKGDPTNMEVLRCAISILMRSTEDQERFILLAGERACSASSPDAIALWLSALFQINADEVMNRLTAILRDAGEPDRIMVQLCSVLSGEQMPLKSFLPVPSYLRPAILRQFVPVVYQHIRFNEDLNRLGAGAYSPTSRDHAQRFREILLARLEQAEEPDATQVLRELADEPAMSRVRDWTLNLLWKRLLNEADLTPWTPADIRDFAVHHEVNPKNDKDLFLIIRNRLEVLKWDVEQSDNSLRDELRVGDPEMQLRRWLQRRLLERSQNRYTLPQEAEIDQQERPDLRVENPTTWPVSIEVKWADNWTLPELLERLENQLIGQYLRAHKSRYGIYLLGFIGKKQHWKNAETGKSLTFADVVEIVRQRSYLLLQSNPKISGLEIVSINFCEPTKRN
jgi:hypothetical protein